MSSRNQTRTFDRKVVLEAIRDSFLKLDPRTQLKNPTVMIVVAWVLGLGAAPFTRRWEARQLAARTEAT